MCLFMLERWVVYCLLFASASRSVSPCCIAMELWDVCLDLLPLLHFSVPDSWKKKIALAFEPFYDGTDKTLTIILFSLLASVSPHFFLNLFAAHIFGFHITDGWLLFSGCTCTSTVRRLFALRQTMVRQGLQVRGALKGLAMWAGGRHSLKSPATRSSLTLYTKIIRTGKALTGGDISWDSALSNARLGLIRNRGLDPSAADLI